MVSTSNAIYVAFIVAIALTAGVLVLGFSWNFLTILRVATPPCDTSACDACLTNDTLLTPLPPPASNSTNSTTPVDGSDSCQQRVLTTIAGTPLITTYDKPDGAPCTDVCLDPSSTRICERGQCKGTCFGNCLVNITLNTTTNISSVEIVSPCPNVTVVNAVLDTANLSTTSFYFCRNSRCYYFIFFNTDTFPEFADAAYQDWRSKGGSMVDYASEHSCLDLIADSTPFKRCLHADFVSVNSAITNSSSSYKDAFCMYRFACMSAPYASASASVLRVKSRASALPSALDGDITLASRYAASSTGAQVRELQSLMRVPTIRAMVLPFASP